MNFNFMKNGLLSLNYSAIVLFNKNILKIENIRLTQKYKDFIKSPEIINFK